ncbi:MAG: hypothetical protein HQL46_09910 [Gammaproteobacteria bacterium]|nr:hypothetical protein [Gammaproteobacteria bacterium]
MLSIFIGFVTIYLSFLLLLIAFKFIFGQFVWLINIEYRELLKIANVSFAIAFMIFLMATIFIIPLNESASIKQTILFGLFGISYFVIVAWAIYDQNKHSKQEDQSNNSTLEG